MGSSIALAVTDKFFYSKLSLSEKSIFWQFFLMFSWTIFLNLRFWVQSVERTGCNKFSCRSGDSLFFVREICDLGKVQLSQNFLLVEKQQSFWAKSSFFKIAYFVWHQYRKFIQYQTRTSSFSRAPSCFLSRHMKILGHLVCNILNFFDLFFILVLYR